MRTANAFAAAAVHVVGRRRWNRRGAMVTDRYQHVHHHADVAALLAWARADDLAVVGRRQRAGGDAAGDRRAAAARACCCSVRRASGLTAGGARRRADQVLSIAQFGSTRSINAGVAAGIAMHAWIRAHAEL